MRGGSGAVRQMIHMCSPMLHLSNDTHVCSFITHV